MEKGTEEERDNKGRGREGIPEAKNEREETENDKRVTHTRGKETEENS